MSCPGRGLSPRLEENSLQDSIEKYAFFPLTDLSGLMIHVMF